MVMGLESFVSHVILKHSNIYLKLPFAQTAKLYCGIMYQLWGKTYFQCSFVVTNIATSRVHHVKSYPS